MSLLKVTGSVLGAIVVVTIILTILAIIGRRVPVASGAARRLRGPGLTLGALIAMRVTLPSALPPRWQAPVAAILIVLTIGSVAWLVGQVLTLLEEIALGRFRVDVVDNLSARRIHTQIRTVRRVAVVGVYLVAAGVALLTFPQLQAAGASVIASAGLAGVVAALAAQSTLANVFAGLQLAFGGALRLDDVVVVEDEWGRVEEMTLGYVVIRIWDQRRLVLPTAYFTTTPFENWTKSSAAILGTVELDVDWSVDLPALRAELEQLVARSPHWDRQVCQVQVTDATAGLVRVRILISAADSSAAWDLRCMVRERMVAWLQREQPAALPRLRTIIDAHPRWPIPTSRVGS